MASKYLLTKSVFSNASFKQSRFFSQTATLNRVENVLVLGSGLMGSGIAQCVAASGKFNSIVLQDVSQAQLDKAKKNMAKSLTRLSERKQIKISSPDEVIARITTSTEVKPASEQNLLVIEAVPEQLELKQKIFRSLSEQFKGNSSVILATNTSFLPCREIKKAVTETERFAALHFFNPVPQMKLVEIARTGETNDATVEALKQFVTDIDHVGVVCKDGQGFIVNRLLGPYMRDALAMLEAGDASVEDIDTAMKLGAGYPMGPFELMDFTGLDTNLFVTESLIKYSPEINAKKSKIVEALVAKGHLGRKTGKGFYEYPPQGGKNETSLKMGPIM